MSLGILYEVLNKKVIYLKKHLILPLLEKDTEDLLFYLRSRDRTADPFLEEAVFLWFFVIYDFLMILAYT